MRWWQYILFPAGLLFGVITWVRRWLFGKGLLKRSKGKIQTVVIGNLTVGGTGKTPMTLFLAQLLHGHRKLGILSRGYGRRSTGFFKVNWNGSAQTYGDEPMEMRAFLPADVPNFVCENRVEGISSIAELHPEIETVLLDDAYQHLHLQGDFYVLLCDYSKPFYKDYPLPAGMLREFPHAANAADAIVVTRCPEDLSEIVKGEIERQLAKYKRPVFFVGFKNHEPLLWGGSELLSRNSPILAVSALAGNEKFLGWAAAHHRVVGSFAYRDHHVFTESDFMEWQKCYQDLGAQGILTTAKDVVKMQELKSLGIKLYVSRLTPFFLFNGQSALVELILKRLK